MTVVLETVLRMDLMGSAVIILVLILRAALPGMPRRMRHLLWLPVLIRLLCPVLPGAPISLFQLLHTPGASTPMVSASAFPAPVGGAAWEQEAAGSPAADPLQIAAWIWLAGLTIIALWSAVCALRLHRRLREAVRIEGNVFLSDQIGVPLAFGMFRPRIYLPCGLPPEEEDLIIAHERVHIRRGDLMLQFGTQIALCLHWFNPLVWLFAGLSRRDMEQACDEAVVCRLDERARRVYAGALLRFAQRRAPAAGTAFGQNRAKERIENVMRYRKSGRSILLISLTCALLLGACSLTDPTSPVQTAAEELVGAASLSKSANSSTETGQADEALLGEYRQAGIDIRADGWYFQNQRVRQLTDGIRSIIRFQHTDPLGTVDVRVIRAETHLPDGSVALFGPITGLQPGSVTEVPSRGGSLTEDASGASGNSAVITVQTRDGSVSTRITDQPGSIASVETMAAEGSAADLDYAVTTTVESAGSEAEQKTKTVEALSKLCPFGVAFEEQSGGLTVFLRGERLCGLLDEGPEETIFYGFDQDGDGPLGVVRRQADGTVAEVVSVSASDGFPF